MRALVTTHPTQEVTLEEELEGLEPFLAIERACLGGRLGVKRDLDRQALGARVPETILQPLVESAVHPAAALRDGELTVAAESTAWATQLRLLQRKLLTKIAAGVGTGVVTKLNIQGPAAPSWRHGQLRVRGRGPRDTYG